MYIAIDLDHTLLNQKGELTQKSIDVLARCKKEGHVLIVNTIRSLFRSKDLAKAINADYIVCFAGNLITDKEGNIIYSKHMESECFENIINDFMTFASFVSCESKDGSLAYSPYENIEVNDNEIVPLAKACSLFQAIPTSLDKVLSEKVFKMSFGVNEIQRKQAAELADKYKLDITFGREGFFCRLMPKNSDKWFGIKQLCEIKQFDINKVIVFGDDLTDILSLKKAGQGVAMANSVPDVLNEIPIHTLSNDQDGVAVYLEENLLN